MPGRSLRLAVAQPDHRPHDLAANARLHAECVRRAAARVVVFPELSLTGYHYDAVPPDPDDPGLKPLIEACAGSGAVALAGAPGRRPGGERTISVWAVDAAGARPVYDKMWLGVAEEDHFAAGTTPAVISVDGWRLGLAVCRDTGVEAHAADTAALGMDAYVAGVLETADDAHVQPVRAARIVAAHRVPVAVAAFAGSTGEGYRRAAGGSAVWVPDTEGRAIPAASVGTEVGDLAVATLRRPHDGSIGRPPVAPAG